MIARLVHFVLMFVLLAMERVVAVQTEPKLVLVSNLVLVISAEMLVNRTLKIVVALATAASLLVPGLLGLLVVMLVLVIPPEPVLSAFSLVLVVVPLLVSPEQKRKLLAAIVTALQAPVLERVLVHL